MKLTKRVVESHNPQSPIHRPRFYAHSKQTPEGAMNWYSKKPMPTAVAASYYGMGAEVATDNPGPKESSSTRGFNLRRKPKQA